MEPEPKGFTTTWGSKAAAGHGVIQTQASGLSGDKEWEGESLDTAKQRSRGEWGPVADEVLAFKGKERL